jgi:NitT/TauT family transport system substrate-binding protein
LPLRSIALPSDVARRRETAFGRNSAAARLFLAALLVVTAAGVARAAGPLDIRIAWTTVPGQLTPVLFGPFAQSHLLQHYGKSYTVTHEHYAGSGPMVSALGAGQIDIAQLAPSSLGFAIENAHLDDVRVITEGWQDGIQGHYSSVFLVRKDSPIKTVDYLKGKVVAVNAFGGALDIAARAMMRLHHLEANKDYSIVEAAFPDLDPMLEKEKVDLISLSLPFSEIAQARGGVRTLFRMEDVFGTTQMLFNVARASFLDKNRAALSDFFADYVRAQRWLLDPANHDQAIELVAEFNKRPGKVYSYLFTDRDDYRDPNARPNLEALQRNMDQLNRLGILKSHVDVRRHADLGFVDAAAKISKN